MIDDESNDLLSQINLSGKWPIWLAGDRPGYIQWSEQQDPTTWLLKEGVAEAIEAVVKSG